jgi:chlorite dismutase
MIFPERRRIRVENAFSFVGGDTGPWRITRIAEAKGPGIAPAARLKVLGEHVPALPAGARWVLRGFTSNLRYATAAEVARLKTVQPALARPAASCAALIPIRKSTAWWELAQDERRRIFEETSRHTAIGLDYLPAVARRLHHSRDLGEPFDFLTWFEFAPEHEAAFDDLLARLRASAEWIYVEREIDIRLVRSS